MSVTSRDILDMNAFHGDGDDPLVARRLASMGAASTLFFERPIEMVSAQGAEMTAADDTVFLDLYNNVPSVGHSHPRVVAAVQDQVARLNTNSRYLSAVTEAYSERLLATVPVPDARIAYTCSGSEANDLALRIARLSTGKRGVVVTEAAYHGNTAAVTEVSPVSYRQGGVPDHVRLIPPPGPAYGDDIAGGFASALRAAIAGLEADGHGFAAFLCDSIFSSDGVFAFDWSALVAAAEVTRTAGGLYIADEVQPGFGRTGRGLWAVAAAGAVPDILTMGKPMGNGFPMAAMVARADLLARFAEAFGYFNTFAGNPVAAAAGSAVLDVIEDEGLIANAAAVGARLKDGLTALDSPVIGAVRGCGLYLGVDIVAGDAPDPDGATRLINALRDRRIMVGAAGRFGHTLKIRPPLCLSAEQADRFLGVFAELTAGPA